MFSKKTFVVVSMVVASLVAACGSNGGNGNTGGNGGGDGGGQTSSTSSKYTCCINDAHYRCPNKAAFDKCAGFDLDACMQACSPSDFTCAQSCFDQAANATNDPSGCQEDPTVQCGGTGGTGGGNVGSCVGDWDGAQCDYDADCASNNCFDNKCYGNDVGNPCEYDADCTSNNCYQNCCYGNAKSDPCEYDADCTSNNCYNNVCQ